MEDMTHPITKKLRYYKINEYFTIEGKGKRPFAQTYYFYAENEDTAQFIARILTKKGKGGVRLDSPNEATPALKITAVKLKKSYIRLAEKKLKLDMKLREMRDREVKGDKAVRRIHSLAHLSYAIGRMLNRLGLPVALRYARGDRPFFFRQALPPILVEEVTGDWKCC